MISTIAACNGGTLPCRAEVPYGQPLSCPDPFAPEGSSQGVCRGGFPITSFCDPGLQCINNVCLPCGDEKEVCCQGPAGPFTCNDPTLACDRGESTETESCQSSCGVIGKRCCENSDCPGSGVCDGTSCVAPPSNNCNQGEPFTFEVIDANGCGQMPVTVLSDGDADATACAQAVIPIGTHLGPVNLECTSTAVCQSSMNGDATQYLCTVSPADLASCEAFEGGTTDTYTSGACPDGN